MVMAIQARICVVCMYRTVKVNSDIISNIEKRFIDIGRGEDSGLSSGGSEPIRLVDEVWFERVYEYQEDLRGELLFSWLLFG